MAASYTFLKPAKLPLRPDALDRAAVLPLPTMESAAALDEAVPGLRWTSQTQAAADVEAGWVEFRLHDDPSTGAFLALRCSLRSDYTAFVQGLCDRFGWVAFDEEPRLFQPRQPPQAL